MQIWQEGKHSHTTKWTYFYINEPDGGNFYKQIMLKDSHLLLRGTCLQCSTCINLRLYFGTLTTVYGMDVTLITSCFIIQNIKVFDIARFQTPLSSIGKSGKLIKLQAGTYS